MEEETPFMEEDAPFMYSRYPSKESQRNDAERGNQGEEGRVTWCEVGLEEVHVGEAGLDPVAALTKHVRLLWAWGGWGSGCRDQGVDYGSVSRV